MPSPIHEKCPDHERPARKRTHNILRYLGEIKAPVIIFLAVISITLGTIGFSKYFFLHHEIKSLATAIYDSFYLFTIEAGNLISPIPWELEVARWLSPLIAMYAILWGFAALFREQVKLLSMVFLKNHVVICGLGQKGLNIARDFQKLHYEIVAIEKDVNNPNIAIGRESGIIVLIGDARDEYLLNKARVKRAKYLIGVCGSDGVNSDVAVFARKLVEYRSGSKLNCSIHIKDSDLWVLLRSQEFSTNTNEAFRLDIFNIYDQGAKQLFREFPFTSGPSNDVERPHLLIVGFGDFAGQLILNAVRKWSPQYDEKNQKLHISVIDPDAETHIRELCQKYSLIDKLCEWRSLAFDTGSAEFLKADFLIDENNQPNVSMVYVMVEDEGIGLSSALRLLERLRTFPVRILVRMNEERGLASLIREANKNGGTFDQLLMFGLMERTCKVDLIHNSTHESISRTIHEEYMRQERLKGNLPGSSPVLMDWECLPEEIKEMNRTQVDNIGEKLKVVGCDIVPWGDFGGDKFVFTPEEIETLAEMEHVRWCAQKRKQGWVYGAARDDKKKIHPSLVEYSDPRLSEAEKEKDRNTVREIPNYLSLAGYQIYRL